MGFIITDLADEKKSLHINFWNWRPTVELVRGFGIVDMERVDLMHLQCVGTTISKDEARQIATRLHDGILTKLRVGERVRLDLSTTAEPDDGTFYRGADTDKNYSATVEWLKKFAEFCSECHGFRVF